MGSNYTIDLLEIQRLKKKHHYPLWWAFSRLWVGLPLTTLWPKGSG